MAVCPKQQQEVGEIFKRIRSEHASRLRENQNKEKKKLFLEIASSRTSSGNASSQQEFYRTSISSLKLITYRSSHQEVFLENSCTFNCTQIILISGTIEMEL